MHRTAFMTSTIPTWYSHEMRKIIIIISSSGRTRGTPRTHTYIIIKDTFEIESGRAAEDQETRERVREDEKVCSYTLYVYSIQQYYTVLVAICRWWYKRMVIIISFKRNLIIKI